MTFEHLSKNKKFLLVTALVILLIGIFAFMYAPVIFQEGNPWPQIKGIVQLTFGGSDMVKLSGSDNKYLTKSQGGPMVVDTFMKNSGYEYTDQMGSGYFYKSSDKTVVLTRRQYSRFYTIWTITINTNLGNDQMEKVKDGDLIMNAVRSESGASQELLANSCVSSIMQETDDLILVYIDWNCGDVGGGTRAILKKQGTDYKFIAMLQDWPSCELMEEFSVPKSFYEACY